MKQVIDRSTAGLREYLFEELELIKNGESNNQRASAVSKISSQILTSVRLEMDYIRFVKQEGLASSYTVPILEFKNGK